MTDATLRDHLDRLVDDEPALGLDLPAIVGEGRRLRRRRRLLTGASGLAGAAAIAAAVAVPLSMPHGSQDRLVLTKPVRPAAAAAPPGEALTPPPQRDAGAGPGPGPHRRGLGAGA